MDERRETDERLHINLLRRAAYATTGFAASLRRSPAPWLDPARRVPAPRASGHVMESSFAITADVRNRLLRAVYVTVSRLGLIRHVVLERCDQVQVVLRASHRHIEQAALFFDLIGARPSRSLRGNFHPTRSAHRPTSHSWPLAE